jgi:serine/threonine-protein kinase HipA
MIIECPPVGVPTAPVIDLANFLNAAIFNYLVGNNDAHGKNFSLVHHDKEIRLAPLYGRKLRCFC